MANGGSPLPAPRPAPSGLPAMPLSPKPRASQTSPHHQIPQPCQILSNHRQSTETLTSIASSSTSYSKTQDQSPPRRPRRPTRSSSPDPSNSSISNNTSPQLSPRSHAPHPRPRQILSQHHHHRHLSSRGSPSPPPTRDLPALRPTHEALLEPRHPAPQPLGQADQFEKITPDAEMILAGFYGLPYCVPVPDVLEQRSRAIAEAEEAEYHRERKSWRQRARLSGRVEAALKGLVVVAGSSRSRSRNGRK
jgi:hypothetical protein